MKTFIALLLLAIVAGVAAESLGRIKGGSDASFREFPFMVTIRSDTDEHLCEGSLIAPNVVLTSAVCVEKYEDFVVAPSYVGIGYHSLSSPFPSAEQISVSKVVVHPSYTPARPSFSVALLILEEDSVFATAELYNGVSAVIGAGEGEGEGEIAGEFMLDADDTVLTVAGWGSLDESGTTPDLLQKVELEVVDATECDDDFSVSSESVCASGDGKSGCRDFGAPLFDTNGEVWTIVGVMHSSDCSSDKSVFTRVSSYLDWICEASEEAVCVGDSNPGSGSALADPAVYVSPICSNICPSNGNCLTDDMMCDGVVDCPGLDEADGCTCSAFSCGDECVPLRAKCNGMSECTDESDEANCECPFACEGSTMCLQETQVCNGTPECPNGDDESTSTCPQMCDNFPITPPGDNTCEFPFTCAAVFGTTCRQGRCVPNSAVNQCPDAKPTTPEGDLTCSTVTKVAPLDCSIYSGTTCRNFWCIKVDDINTVDTLGCDAYPLTPPGDNSCDSPTFCMSTYGTTCRDGACVQASSINACCDKKPKTPYGDGTCTEVNENIIAPLDCSQFEGTTCRNFWCIDVDWLGTTPAEGASC